MSKAASRGLLMADFTIGNLSNFLAASDGPPGITTTVAHGLSVMGAIADASAEHWSESHDFAVAWARPEMVSPAFAARLDFSPSSLEDALADVDAYCQGIVVLRSRVPLVLVPTFSLSPRALRPGPLDMRTESGVSGLLLQMNARLVERLAAHAGVFVLDSSRWLAKAPPANPALWYAAKVPFAPDVFKQAAEDIIAAVAASRGLARKLLVLDLDNTLWGGVVGEVGWEHVRLGGHDAIGEAFLEFQRAVKALSRRGVVLGLVSKNDEARALEGIAKHAEMVLRPNDFAAYRINWEDKARNIADLVAELNVGLDSVVFIDDHPVERARVREALPAVLVPEWPVDPMHYTEALAALRCFDTLTWTSEDAERNHMYVADRERKRVRDDVGSMDDWLRSLGTKVSVELLHDANADRVLQLINKTNQMNLTTRRVTPDELASFREGDRKRLWAFRVTDRFGDSGLVGVASLEHDGKRAQVADFLLSCRVFGRSIEHAMLFTILDHAQKVGLEAVSLAYTPTAKNGVTKTFLVGSGLSEDGGTFAWKRGEPVNAPAYVELMHRDAGDKI